MEISMKSKQTIESLQEVGKSWMPDATVYSATEESVKREGELTLHLMATLDNGLRDESRALCSPPHLPKTTSTASVLEIMGERCDRIGRSRTGKRSMVFLALSESRGF